MLKNFLQQAHTPDKFYDIFLASPMGKEAFDCAYRLYHLDEKPTSFVNYIINSMQNWFFEQLTDDEMNSAYTFFQSIEPELRNITLNSIE